MPQDKDHYLHSQSPTDHPTMWTPLASTSGTVPAPEVEKKDDRRVVTLLDMEP